MRASSIYSVATLAALLLAALSCGGGSGAVSVASGGVGGSGGTDPAATVAVTAGTITQFGSIHVDGLRFDSSAAAVMFDGQAGGESDLLAGMYVFVRGSVNSGGESGSASLVEFRYVAKGRVEDKDDSSRTLSVSGSTVYVDDSTVLHDKDWDDIAVGDYALVSGYSVSGGLRATLIRAIGTRPSELASAGELEETSATDMSVRFSGFISSALSGGRFTLNKRSVALTTSTVIDGGSSNDLQPPVFVFVSGRLEQGGGIRAERIYLIRKPEIVLCAPVQAVDAQKKTVRVLDSVVSTNSFTLYKDGSAARLRNFGSSSLAAGDQIFVTAWRDSAGALRARRIDRIVPIGSVILQDREASLTQGGMTMLGKTVLFSDSTLFYRNRVTQIGRVEASVLINGGKLTAVIGQENTGAVEARYVFVYPFR